MPKLKKCKRLIFTYSLIFTSKYASTTHTCQFFIRIAYSTITQVNPRLHFHIHTAFAVLLANIPKVYFFLKTRTTTWLRQFFTRMSRSTLVIQRLEAETTEEKENTKKDLSLKLNKLDSPNLGFLGHELQKPILPK